MGHKYFESKSLASFTTAETEDLRSFSMLVHIVSKCKSGLENSSGLNCIICPVHSKMSVDVTDVSIQ